MLCAAIVVSAVLGFGPPSPSEAIPREPERLAGSLARTTAALDAAIDRWRRTRAQDAAPTDVMLYALYQQRIYRALSRDPRLARAPLGPALPVRANRQTR
jgi:hypothetical protein